MRKIFDDITGDEIKEDDLCIVQIFHKGKNRPFMKPLEVSSITADKIRNYLHKEFK